MLLYIDAVASPADTGLIYTAITSRLGYAMARNGNAPQGLARLNRTGVPWAATIISFVVGLVIFLPFPSWQELVGLVTTTTVLSFGSGPLVMAAMRRSLADRERPFKLPGSDIVPLLAFYSSNMIVFWAGWDTNWKLFVAIAAGYVLLVIFRAMNAISLRAMQWRSGAWIPVWLAGLALISWLSSYEGIGLIGLGWGFVVNAVWSVLIYWWAVSVRLTGERMTEILASTPHDEEDSSAELVSART